MDQLLDELDELVKQEPSPFPLVDEHLRQARKAYLKLPSDEQQRVSLPELV